MNTSPWNAQNARTHSWTPKNSEELQWTQGSFGTEPTGVFSTIGIYKYKQNGWLYYATSRSFSGRAIPCPGCPFAATSFFLKTRTSTFFFWRPKKAQLWLKLKYTGHTSFYNVQRTKENPCKGLTTHSKTLSLLYHSTRPAKEVPKEPQPK
jgi:hypothetical protein